MKKKNNYKKKLEELLKSAEKDKKFLLDTRNKLTDEINKIAFQLAKNDGAILILKKILEDK